MTNLNHYKWLSTVADYKSNRYQILMKTIIPAVLSFYLFLLPVDLLAQNQSMADNGSHLTITSNGEAMAPADIASMSINISINHENAARAFELHRERESFLAELLKELEFEDEQINYRPVTVRPNRQRDGDIHSSTTQQIRLQLNDIEMLGQLQVKLIQNGFDNFSGSLSSTQLEEASDEALRQAVDNAQKDAEILAMAAGRKLGSIISIGHRSDHNFRPAALGGAFEVRAMSDAGPSIQNFSQTVSVQKQVTIVFEMTD